MSAWRPCATLLFSLWLCIFTTSLVAAQTPDGATAQQPKSPKKTSANTSAQTKKRIVALAPHIVELLFEIGAEDTLLAASDYSDYPQAARALPRVGNHQRLQIEKIAALQPDVILAWRGGSPMADVQKLQSLGLEVAFSDIKTLADIAKELRWLGRLTGHSDEAQAAAQAIESKLHHLSSQQPQKPLSVFYELWHQPLTTVAKGSWPQHILQHCGAQNPFAESDSPYPQVNIEQVLASGVRVIIQPDSAKQPGFAWQQWQKAIAPARFIIVKPNADKLHRMTSRTVDEVIHLCAEITALANTAG